MMREGSKADPFLPKIEESLLRREGGGEVRGEAKAEGLPEAAETGFKWSKLAVEEDLEMALAVWMRRTCEGMRLREKEKKRKEKTQTSIMIARMAAKKVQRRRQSAARTRAARAQTSLRPRTFE